MILFERRASAIIYNVLRARRDDRPFLLPANVCSVVPLTFHKAGQRFEFVDIDPGTLCIDTRLVEEKLRAHRGAYGGVLFVRTYGVSADPGDFITTLKSLDRTLLFIDDRCLCRPELRAERQSAADLELFSTGYSKYVDIEWGGFGYAGDDLAYESSRGVYDETALAALKRDVEGAIKARSRLRRWEGDWLDLGAPGIAVAEYQRLVSAALPRAAAQKSLLNAIYRERLPATIQMRSDSQTWRFSIYVRDKEVLLADIFRSGLFASSHYPSLGGILGDGRFPAAEALHGSVVNLFNDFRFDADKARRACDIVNAHVRQTGLADFHDVPASAETERT